jgi:hypothetical protein
MADDNEDEKWNSKEGPREHPTFKEFSNLLSEKDLEPEYSKAIDGTQGTFLIFKGGELEKVENQSSFEALYAGITKDCIDFAKRIMETRPQSLITGEVKPPFMIFLGTPKVFSGTRDFYQSFNVLLPTIDFRKEEDFSQIALQEMTNHQNCVNLAFVSSKDQIEKFPDQLFKMRKTIVVYTGDRTKYKEVFDECFSKNLRTTTFFEDDYKGCRIIC